MFIFQWWQIVFDMPELAEVAWFAKQWSLGVGHKVTEVLCHERARIYRSANAAEIRRRLPGRRLTEIRTRGKQMLFVFEGSSLGLHLGMTGELLTEGKDHKPGKHDHLVIRQAKWSLVFRDPRMFGALRFEANTAEPAWWQAMAPDLVSAAFTREVLEDFLRRRKARPMKAVLLMQECFPGVGNWMADEILWRCRIHPSRTAGALSKAEVDDVWRETRKLCRDAVRIIGKNWGDPPKSWLFPHRWRAGGKCPRDGKILLREEIGGRTTAWCPLCQRHSDRS